MSIHGHVTRTSEIKVENVHKWVKIHPDGLFDMRVSIYVILGRTSDPLIDPKIL